MFATRLDMSSSGVCGAIFVPLLYGPRIKWDRFLGCPVIKVVCTIRSDGECSPYYRSWYTTNPSTNRTAQPSRDGADNHAVRISARLSAGYSCARKRSESTAHEQAGCACKLYRT